MRDPARRRLPPRANPFFHHQTPSATPGRREEKRNAMVQGYYTLDEAARILKMSPEKLSQMAQKREVRAFADRGTWRFRTQDVEEMARRQGQASDEVPSLGADQPASAKGKATQLAEGTEPLCIEVSPGGAEGDPNKPPG